MAKEKNDTIKIMKVVTMFIEFLNEYDGLINYVNKQLTIISYTYNLTVNIYHYSIGQQLWVSIGKKFKQADVLKIDQKEKDNFKIGDKGSTSSNTSNSN
jgi:hypothetical protein